VPAAGEAAPRAASRSSSSSSSKKSSKSSSSSSNKSSSSTSSAAGAPAAEAPAAAAPAAEADAVPDAQAARDYKRQYLGTWSHTDLDGLKQPADLSKGELGELVMRLSADTFAVQHRNRVRKVAVVDERHADGKLHKHFAMLAELPWGTHALEVALRRERIYVQFSSTHDYYWTTFAYLTVPGDGPDHKGPGDIDPDGPWLSPGHPSVRESLLDVPRGARRCDKQRVRDWLGVEVSRSSTSSPTMCMSDQEMQAYIRQNKLYTQTALLAFVETELVQARAAGDTRRLTPSLAAEAYCLKYRRDLATFVEFVWSKAHAPQLQKILGSPVWDIICWAKEGLPCVCRGQWIPLTERMLREQCEAFPEGRGIPTAEKPESAAVRAAHRICLQRGCAKGTNVYVYGPRSSAKSHTLSPPASILGEHCFVRPVNNRGGQGNNYPLQGLLDKKLCVLQDLRISTFNLSFDAMLVWWEGTPFDLVLPRNHYKSNVRYRDRVGVFASSGSKLRIPHREAVELQVDPLAQNDMMDERWRYFYHARGYHRSEQVDCLPCGRCYAHWVTARDPDVDAIVAATPAGLERQGTGAAPQQAALHMQQQQQQLAAAPSPGPQRPPPHVQQQQSAAAPPPVPQQQQQQQQQSAAAPSPGPQRPQLHAQQQPAAAPPPVPQQAPLHLQEQEQQQQQQAAPPGPRPLAPRQAAPEELLEQVRGEILAWLAERRLPMPVVHSMERLANDLRWSSRYRPTFGRIGVFLRKYNMVTGDGFLQVP